MTSHRQPRRIAARTVTTTDGARAHIPAVTLVDASAVAPCYCAGCSRRIEARSALQNLGLTLREAEEALRGAPDDAPVEDLVKFALTRKAVT